VMPACLLVNKIQDSAAYHANSQGACRVIHIDRADVEAAASRAFRGWCARVLLGRIGLQPGDRAAEVARRQQEATQAILTNMVEAAFRFATVRDPA